MVRTFHLQSQAIPAVPARISPFAIQKSCVAIASLHSD
jgi:hypothetical protein